MRKVSLLLLAVVLVLSVIPGMVTAAGEVKECSWSPSTTYTDGTPYEASKTVFYNAWMDNQAKAVKTTNTWFQFVVPDHNVAHQFTVQTELSTGEKSAISPPYTWVSPAGTPTPPAGGCTVGNPIH